jgi:hypothetical protein
LFENPFIAAINFRLGIVNLTDSGGRKSGGSVLLMGLAVRRSRSHLHGGGSHFAVVIDGTS